MLPIPYRQWGVDLDANALQQMENACRLPVSVAAALMPVEVLMRVDWC